MVVIKLCRDLNLNKSQIKFLLNGLRPLLPSDSQLPRTVPGLMKVVGIDCSKKVSYYCRECFHPLLTPQQTECTNGCAINNQRRSFKYVSELVISDAQKEISSTTKLYLNLIREYPN
ncbi:unnamed protein product [Didymodactylos carnosus]|uniref:Uncharacterized protein n=1 Tax=Didymodactylos carnosus TaxID=1234261 RepID=A0A8S2Y210_9BILA|nr:unnamed protein product [Didymodactylos carnosus]